MNLKLAHRRLDLVKGPKMILMAINNYFFGSTGSSEFELDKYQDEARNSQVDFDVLSWW